MKTCPDCNGDGVIENGTDDEEQCPRCGGSGFVPNDNDDKNNEEVIRTSAHAAPVAAVPFRLLLTCERITTATTIAELRRRYRCQNCGSSHAALFAPWRLGGSMG